MDSGSENFAKWGWGVAAPLVLWCLSIAWLLAGEVHFSGRSGGTVYRGWGLWACAGGVAAFGMRLHADCFLDRVPGRHGIAAVVSIVSGWLTGAGLLGCIAWVLARARPF